MGSSELLELVHNVELLLPLREISLNHHVLFLISAENTVTLRDEHYEKIDVSKEFSASKPMRNPFESFHYMELLRITSGFQ